MKKKLFIIITLLLIVLFIVFIGIIEHNYQKKKFKEGLPQYLSNKYEENMIIEKVNFSIEEGFYAIVYPENASNLDFEVIYATNIDDYSDNYLTEYLKNNIYSNLLEIFAEGETTKIYIDLIPPCSYDILYSKYKELHKPPTWSEINAIPNIQRIKIYFEKMPDKDRLYDILYQISLLKYNIYELRLFDNDNKSCVFDNDEIIKAARE